MLINQGLPDLIQRRSFCRGSKMSSYAADYNLLPHLQNISRDGTLHTSVPSCRKHVPDLLSETEKRLQHQTEKVQHSSLDQMVKSFLGSEQRYWRRASLTDMAKISHDIVCRKFTQGEEDEATCGLTKQSIPALCHCNGKDCYNDVNTCILFSLV